jgi:hypothetical protein
LTIPFEQFTMPFAVAPSGIFAGEAHEERLEFSIGGRAAGRAWSADGRRAPDPGALPPQPGRGRKEPRDPIHGGTGTPAHIRTLGGTDRATPFFPMRKVPPLRMLTVQDAHLLPKQQNLEILLRIGAAQIGEPVKD